LNIKTKLLLLLLLLLLSITAYTGCDLPGVWKGSTHPFVLFYPVLEHYE